MLDSASCYPTLHNKGTLPNFDLLDEKLIVGMIDFWTNFSTRQPVYNIKNTQLDD